MCVINSTNERDVCANMAFNFVAKHDEGKIKIVLNYIL